MIPGWSQLQLMVCGGLALAAVLAGGFAWYQYERADDAVALERFTRAGLTAALEANGAQAKVISELRTSVDDWRRLATPDEAMRKRAALAVVYETELNKARAALDARAREVDDAKPDCERLLNTDFERVCPFYARRLRERASGGTETGGGADPRAGGEEGRRVSPEALRGPLPLSTGRDAGAGHLGAPRGR